MLSSILQNSLKCILHHSSNVKTGFTVGSRTISTVCSPLYFQVTNSLFAEPMKKKRRLDPQILKAREDRKRRRIEKQIRKMQKQARQLKPIIECEVPAVLFRDEKKLRVRPDPKLSAEELNHRVISMKKWACYRLKQHLADTQMIDRILFSQQKALDELRLESEELYQEAIQLDPLLIPKTINGPVVTPKIEKYESPDGEYIDTSKKW